MRLALGIVHRASSWRDAMVIRIALPTPMMTIPTHDVTVVMADGSFTRPRRGEMRMVGMIRMVRNWGDNYTMVS
jgi:hypothetical protein